MRETTSPLFHYHFFFFLLILSFQRARRSVTYLRPDAQRRSDASPAQFSQLNIIKLAVSKKVHTALS